MKFNISKQFFMLALGSAVLFSCSDASESIAPEIQDEKGTIFKNSASKPTNPFGFQNIVTDPVIRDGSGSGHATHEQTKLAPGLYGSECITSGQESAFHLVVPEDILTEYPDGYYTLVGAAYDETSTSHEPYTEQRFGYNSDDLSDYTQFNSPILFLTLPYRHENETWRIRMTYRYESKGKIYQLFIGAMILKADHSDC